MTKKCLLCDKVIEDTDKKIMVALDVPYVNLWMHKDCHNTIKHNLHEFISANVEKVYNYIVEKENTHHKERKTWKNLKKTG